MAREFFKNLPNTTTPLTAPRLNGLLDGDEAMGNIVVDSVMTKNIFNSDNPSAIHSGMTWTGSGKAHYLTSTISFSGGIRWYFNVKAGEEYTFSYKQRNSNSVYLYIRERQTPEWSGTTLKSIVNDATGTSYSFTIENDCYLEITFQTGATVSNVLFEELQLEKGLTKTDYADYKGIGYVSGSNANGNYIKYDDGTLIQWGIIDKTKFLNSSATSTAVQGINWYRSNNPSISLPTSFIDTNYSVNLTVLEGISGSRFIIPETFSKTATGMTVQLIGVEDFTSSGTAYSNLTSVSYIAIGRWK